MQLPRTRDCSGLVPDGQRAGATLQEHRYPRCQDVSVKLISLTANVGQALVCRSCARKADSADQANVGQALCHRPVGCAREIGHRVLPSSCPTHPFSLPNSASSCCFAASIACRGIMGEIGNDMRQNLLAGIGGKTYPPATLGLPIMRSKGCLGRPRPALHGNRQLASVSLWQTDNVGQALACRSCARKADSAGQGLPYIVRWSATIGVAMQTS
jgi:hypothetical protein